MSPRLVLPTPLRELAGDRAAVELGPEVRTVAQAFESLRSRHPAVYDRILTEQRELRPHVNVFVGTEDIRWSGGLAAALDDDSEVVVLPSVSGG